MVSERPRGDSSPTPESGGWEYCVLSFRPAMRLDLRFYLEYCQVNPRHHVDSKLRQDVERQRRKKEPDRDPLNSYYEKRFLERFNETGGFGESDAINILAEDNWEIVSSTGLYSEMGYNAGHAVKEIIFKRPKGASPELPPAIQE